LCTGPPHSLIKVGPCHLVNEERGIIPLHMQMSI
jgi:hypothetical protein